MFVGFELNSDGEEVSVECNLDEFIISRGEPFVATAFAYFIEYIQSTLIKPLITEGLTVSTDIIPAGKHSFYFDIDNESDRLITTNVSEILAPLSKQLQLNTLAGIGMYFFGICKELDERINSQLDKCK